MRCSHSRGPPIPVRAVHLSLIDTPRSRAAPAQALEPYNAAILTPAQAVLAPLPAVPGSLSHGRNLKAAPRRACGRTL